MLGKVTTGDDVVICGGGEVGVETALEVARRENGKVTVVEMKPDLFKTIVFRQMMDEYEVDRYTSTEIKEITETGVVCEKDGETFEIPAKTVVLAFGYKPDHTLAEEIKDVCADVKVIGGSVKTSTALDATRDAFGAVISL